MHDKIRPQKTDRTRGIEARRQTIERRCARHVKRHETLPTRSGH